MIAKSILFFFSRYLIEGYIKIAAGRKIIKYTKSGYEMDDFVVDDEDYVSEDDIDYDYEELPPHVKEFMKKRFDE